jgi:protein-disulfide isomerase
MTPTPDSPSQEETFTFKRSHFYALLVLLAFAAGLLVGYAAWGRTSAAVAAAPPAQAGAAPQAPDTVEDAIPAPTQAVRRYDIPTEGFPGIGPEDAPIVIVQFTDYECPFCKRWHDQVYDDLMEAYPGKIRLVNRNLPLSFHPQALPAAQAAMCAGDQNSYWAYHSALFTSEALDKDTLIGHAATLGLDVDAFKECFDEGRYEQFIRDDAAFAQKMGITGTPTFFINGLAIVGAQPLEVFKNVIDKEIAGEIPQ